MDDYTVEAFFPTSTREFSCRFLAYSDALELAQALETGGFLQVHMYRKITDTVDFQEGRA